MTERTSGWRAREQRKITVVIAVIAIAAVATIAQVACEGARLQGNDAVCSGEGTPTLMRRLDADVAASAHLGLAACSPGQLDQAMRRCGSGEHARVPLRQS